MGGVNSDINEYVESWDFCYGGGDQARVCVVDEKIAA